MVLSDRDIRTAIRGGKIKIAPRPDFKTQLGSCSLDLRLADSFRVFEYDRSAFIDVADRRTFAGITREHRLKKREPFVLHPGQFVLGATLEKIKLPNDITARIDGRSSLGRLGLVIHSTAGHVDPGYEGQLTLEIANIGKLPIILHKGLRICQLVFENLSSPTSKGYRERRSSKWNKAGGLKASR